MVLIASAFALALLTQGGQATLQSCVFEADGWVCRYRVPDAIYRPELAVPLPAPVQPPAPAPALAPVFDLPQTAPDEEAVRQARLISRCADAHWLSLCTPDDRRQAKALQARAMAREALRLEVAGLVAKDQCPEAVKAALEGGDLELAKEIRAFCAPQD